jgi:hypothetical protein
MIKSVKIRRRRSGRKEKNLGDHIHQDKGRRLAHKLRKSHLIFFIWMQDISLGQKSTKIGLKREETGTWEGVCEGTISVTLPQYKHIEYI